MNGFQGLFSIALRLQNVDSTQAFLIIDAVLRLALNLSNGLIVNPEVMERVDEFLAEEIEPIRRRYASLLGQTSEVSV